MKKIDISQAITILANIGVLASVVFLAIEIRSNSTAIRQQEIGALGDQGQALNLASGGADWAALAVKGYYEPQDLTLVELRQLTALLGVRASILRRSYSAYKNGVLEQDDWDSRLESTPIYFGTSIGRVFWDHLKADYTSDPDFVDAVDNALRTSATVPDDKWLLELQERVQGINE